jgi:hypothetical protein
MRQKRSADGIFHRRPISAGIFLAAPIAQLDRASDYGSKKAPFAIFSVDHQLPASITASTTYSEFCLAMIIWNLLKKEQTV